MVRIAGVVAVAGLCGAAGGAHGQCTGGEWETLAPMQLARQESGAAKIGGLIYTLGGSIVGSMGHGEPTDAVEVYNIASNSWSWGPSMPIARDHIGVAALGNKIYVVGGYSELYSAHPEVMVLDTATGQWSFAPNLPQPRGAGWATAFNGKIYYFGGLWDWTTRNTTYVFDPVTNQWTTGAPMPTPREHVSGAVWGDYIYLIAGRDFSTATNAMERYHPATNTWTSLAAVPTTRSIPSTAALGGKIVVAGGEIPVLVEATEVYDIATNTWSCLQDMPVPRHGMMGIVIDENRVFMGGGGIINGHTPTTYTDQVRVPWAGGNPPPPPNCWANCDGSAGTPALSMQDFACFQQRFFAGDTYANCDNSTRAPVLNVSDFVCFMQRFTQGCPG